jgi:hypothetical protein
MVVDASSVKTTPNRDEIAVPASMQAASAVDEEVIYAAIATELETRAADKGLWIRLFAECDGDEIKTKVAYIKQRAEKLKLLEQEKARTQREARQRREEMENEAAAENAKRAAESERDRLRLVAEGHLTYATIDECLALLRKAGYSADQTDQGWLVRSAGNLGSPTVLKDLPALRLYVEKLAFARATTDECIAEFTRLGCGVALKSNGLTTVTLPSGDRRILEEVGEFRALVRKLHAQTVK